MSKYCHEEFLYLSFCYYSCANVHSAPILQQLQNAADISNNNHDRLGSFGRNFCALDKTNHLFNEGHITLASIKYVIAQQLVCQNGNLILLTE